MNQHKLQQKRRKRQANRKEAQARAKRRGQAEKSQRETALYELSHPRKPRQVPPGFFGKLFGGTQITPDQMDAEPAPLEGGASK